MIASVFRIKTGCQCILRLVKTCQRCYIDPVRSPNPVHEEGQCESETKESSKNEACYCHENRGVDEDKERFHQ